MFVKTLPLGSGSSSADQTPAQAPGVQRFFTGHASPVCFYLWRNRTRHACGAAELTKRIALSLRSYAGRSQLKRGALYTCNPLLPDTAESARRLPGLPVSASSGSGGCKKRLRPLRVV